LKASKKADVAGGVFLLKVIGKARGDERLGRIRDLH